MTSTTSPLHTPADAKPQSSPLPADPHAPGLWLRDINLEVSDGTQERRVLDSVSAHAAPGEILGITGPSGSGKSTLLSVAGCLQDPSSGEAFLRTTDSQDAIRLTGLHPRAAARVRREHIGIVFQQPNLLPALKVKEQLIAMLHLATPWPMNRHVKHSAEQRADELLDAVGLPGMAHRKVGELSGGQQARVNLARALMNDPQLLLIDEPTAALDTENANRITELIRTMARKSKAATLYVSHDKEQLDTLDRVITLVDGRITG